ncbi:hypothetical protein ACJMK2_023180 [Sinanodonta woodiana]|uniref:GTP-binding protein 10 n=1 Tax=Sinanodonta woodiana TaxID=1069815 RepID=A0ABD3T3D3_SINWO
MLSKFLIPRRLFSRNIKDIKRKIEIKESKELQLEDEAEERTRRFKKKFFDSLRIYVRGGGGGQGLPKYGGVGGKGGDVHVVSSKDITLKKVYDTNPSKRYIAGTGTDSRKMYLLGEDGASKEIFVPVGVSIKTDEGRTIADLNEDGQRALVAKGGDGGSPYNNFLGQKGEVRSITLDLKLIADIGLVGFPNAGKSTFLAAISRAQPKIAEYPFTTIQPQVGTMMYRDYRQITVADLPGLIEGAHVNFGMGHKFLKHVERTKLLLFLVDINGFQLSPKYQSRSAFETLLLLNKELELFNPEMLDKPAILALNKIDTDHNSTADHVIDLVKNLPDSLSEVPKEMHPQRLVKFDEIFKMSAKNRENTDIVKERLRELLDLYAGLKESNNSLCTDLQKVQSVDKPYSSNKEVRKIKLV